MPEADWRGRIKLIALDLDGTTLTSRREIHPDNLTAIQRAVAAGMTVVLASGRIRPSMTPYAHQLGLKDGPLICANGAHIVDANGSTLSASLLRPHDQNAIIDFALSEGLHVNGYTTDQMFYLNSSPWLDLYRSRARTIPAEQISETELRSAKLIKLMVIAEPAAIRSIAVRGHQLFDTEEVTLTESEPEYLEFLTRSSNKGAALEHLAAHLGVEKTAVLAVGDYLNDVEMVRWAGLGVAMGNAVAEVKSVARKIVSNNDGGGVAEAIGFVLD